MRNQLHCILLPILVPIPLRWYLPLSVPIPPDDTCRYGYNNFNPYKPQMHLTRAVNNRRAFANCYMHITRNRLRHLKLQDAYHTRAVHKLRHRYLLKACHTGGSHTAAGPSTTRSFTVFTTASSPPPQSSFLFIFIVNVAMIGIVTFIIIIRTIIVDNILQRIDGKIRAQ